MAVAQLLVVRPHERLDYIPSLLPVIRTWMFRLHHALFSACSATRYTVSIDYGGRVDGDQATAICLAELFGVHSRIAAHVYFCTTLVDVVHLAADEG